VSRPGAIEAVLHALVEDAVRRVIQEAPMGGSPGPGGPPPATPPLEAEYLTTVQAGAIAKVRPATIRRWIEQGELRGHRAGRLLRVRGDDLHAFLARVTTPTDGAIDLDEKADAILRARGAGRRSAPTKKRGG